MISQDMTVTEMTAMLIELRQTEEAALRAFAVTESTYGVQGEHPAKDEAQQVVSAASDKVLSLLERIASARPSRPDDIGRQIKAILSVSGDGGIMKRGEIAALSAASSALLSCKA